MNSNEINAEIITNYIPYMKIPLQLAGCWDWFPKPKGFEVFINNIYLCMVIFVLTQLAMVLVVHLYTEWMDVMSSLDEIADSLPIVVSIAIITYYAIYKNEFYELIDCMNGKFKCHSARGLTNMTMHQSYNTARRFAWIYTGCTMFSVTMYATLPVIVHLWTKEPIQSWIYMNVNESPFFEFVFLHTLLGQCFVGLAMGQFGVFFASNSILICGQLDLLCCSLRNLRHTALLQNGVQHATLASAYADIQQDEKNSYTYNIAEMTDSDYHYDTKIKNHLMDRKTHFDIYSTEYDLVTMDALRDCAHLFQMIKEYKEKFERFVSPLLALRVVQVTLYLCTLLYAATLQFEMITVEYLAAVALDIFVYCYFGNQIILQADRLTTAAYQSLWHTMGVRPRRVLLNILLATKKPLIIRAGRFLPIDLQTFVVIIKTSFSYYTLLVNVNEK